MSQNADSPNSNSSSPRDLTQAQVDAIQSNITSGAGINNVSQVPDSARLSGLGGIIGGGLGLALGGPFGGAIGTAVGVLYGGLSEAAGESIIYNLQKTRALLSSRHTGNPFEVEMAKIQEKDLHSPHAQMLKKTATYMAFGTGQLVLPLITSISYYSMAAAFKIKDFVFGKKHKSEDKGHLHRADRDSLPELSQEQSLSLRKDHKAEVPLTVQEMPIERQRQSRERPWQTSIERAASLPTIESEPGANIASTSSTSTSTLQSQDSAYVKSLVKEENPIVKKTLAARARPKFKSKQEQVLQERLEAKPTRQTTV